MLTPYPHQTKLIAQTRGALKVHRRVLLQAPTGSGKTVMATDMVGRASKRVRVWFVVHRQELIDQSAATFKLADIDFGYIAAGYRADPFASTQIASIDTLKRRHSGLQPPEIIFLDEAHHVGAKGWAAVMDAYPDAYIVGLSATPERLDGKGLDSQFDAMVRGPSIQWLIENKYLADYKIFPPKGGGVNRDEFHVRKKEFVRGEVEYAMERPQIVGDIVANYKKHAIDKKGLAFCVSRKSSYHLAEQLRAAGIFAVHLDGDTPKHERKQTVMDYREDKIQVLTNVGLFGEGFDCPEAQALIDADPTKSLNKKMQRDGRVLRTKADGSPALIFDHARNWEEHGLPDDQREWSLQGKEAREAAKSDEADIQARQCGKCFAVHRPAPRCPECGYVYQVKPREVDQVDGELEEVSKEELRRQRRMRQGMCKSLDEFIEFAKAEGYRKPEFWAAKAWTGRQAAKKKSDAARQKRAEQQYSMNFGG